MLIDNVYFYDRVVIYRKDFIMEEYDDASLRVDLQTLYTKKWLVFVGANDDIKIMKMNDSNSEETSLIVNALKNPSEERNRLAIKVMGCDDDTLLRLKLFLG